MRTTGVPLPAIAIIVVMLLTCTSVRAGEVLLFEHLAPGPDGGSFEHICCQPASAPPEDGPADTLTTRYGGGPYWIRFVEPARPGVLALTAMVDVVEIYVRDPVTGAVRSSAAGDTLPVSVRELVSLRLAFRLLDSESGAEIYMRIVQPTRLNLRFELLEPLGFAFAEARMFATRMFFIGAILMIALFNLFLSLTARDATFLFNALTILCLVLLDVYLSGLGAAYVWGAAPWLSNPLLLLATAGPVIFASGFFRLFLRNRHAERFWRDRGFLILPTLAVATLLAMAWLPYWRLQAFALMLGLAALLHFIAACLYGVVRREIRSTLLLAPLLLAVTPGLALLTAQYLLGVSVERMGNHVLELTLALEALLFSVALAYRLRLAEHERTEAHDALAAHNRTMRRRLLDTLDAERSRISSALHETAGHGFLAITSRIARIGSTPGMPAATRGELMEIAALSQVLVGELRHVSHELHLGTLNHLGLARAIKALLERMRATGISARFDCTGLDEERLDREQQVHLFRIVQEVLINVAKHSGASTVAVGLNIDDGSVILRVTDDGCGLQAESGDRTGGLGMTLIDERAEALGARWTVSSMTAGTVFDLSCRLSGGGTGGNESAQDRPAG